MKIEIIYESKTGNTKLIAEALKEACQKDNTVIVKDVEEALEISNKDNSTDLYFLGSWTNKGDCGDLIKKFCNSLEKEKVAIFGTAGFGGSQEYYEKLADRFSNELPTNNKILGSFYCQGKMPMGIRNRYEFMLKKNPEDEKLQVSIENFDDAQSHPDKDDLANAKIFASRILEGLSRL